MEEEEETLAEEELEGRGKRDGKRRRTNEESKGMYLSEAKRKIGRMIKMQQ